MVLESIATVNAGLFAGAALYINAGEHPVAVKMGLEYAVRSFAYRYQHGAVMQAPLALIGLGCGVGAWAGGSGLAWLAGALTLGAVGPITRMVNGTTTNAPLMDAEAGLASTKEAALLSRWAWLHGVRTVLGGAAFVVFVAALAA